MMQFRRTGNNGFDANTHTHMYIISADRSFRVGQSDFKPSVCRHGTGVTAVLYFFITVLIYRKIKLSIYPFGHVLPSIFIVTVSRGPNRQGWALVQSGLVEGATSRLPVYWLLMYVPP